jgi:hypothetical protein
VSRCASCGAQVRWLRNERTNRLAPIDSTPTPGGNIEAGGETYRALAHQPRLLAEAAGLALHTSHFQTCPDRLDWRGRTRKLAAP